MRRAPSCRLLLPGVILILAGAGCAPADVGDTDEDDGLEQPTPRVPQGAAEGGQARADARSDRTDPADAGTGTGSGADAPPGGPPDGGSPGPDGAGPGGAPPDAAADAGAVRSGIPASAAVFEDGKLDVYAITVAPRDFQTLEETALMETYVPAMLTVSGQPIGRVGIRYKGASTLTRCYDRVARKTTCPKMSFKVKFDQYEPDRRHHGLKKINLHALNGDPTLLHDRLAYQMFRDMGIVAPRAVHARVVLNGQPKGVYALVEAPDGRFTADRWPGAGNGNLYKEAWPVSTDPAYFERKLETNEGRASHDAFVAFSRALGEAPRADLPRVLARWADADYLLRYMAVDRAMNNWDGVTGWYCNAAGTSCANHNYYWYQAGDRFWLVPWDLDLTYWLATPFDRVPPWNTTPADCSQRHPIYTTGKGMAPGCDRVFQALAALGHAAFARAVQQLLDGPFDLARVRRDLDRWTAQISDAVKTDPVVNHATWLGNVDRFKRELETHRRRLIEIRDRP